MSQPAKQRLSDSVVWRQLRDGVVVLDTRTGKYFQLDAAGAGAWASIAAGVDVRETSAKEFVAGAIAEGLIEETPTASLSGTHGDGPLCIARDRLRVRGSLAELQERYRRHHHIRLDGLLAPDVTRLVLRGLDEGEFAERTHEGIGTESCLVSGLATSLLGLVFNDPRLLDAISTITGCWPLGCFDGRVYRLDAGAGHYDSWHSDVGEDRQVGLSLNLSSRPYGGGTLELRAATAADTEQRVENPSLGSAVLFEIAPTLRHRVSGVTGAEPRTAYAGWFRSTPDFQDLFFASVNAAR